MLIIFGIIKPSLLPRESTLKSCMPGGRKRLKDNA
jgi:hypothetical protein